MSIYPIQTNTTHKPLFDSKLQPGDFMPSEQLPNFCGAPQTVEVRDGCLYLETVEQPARRRRGVTLNRPFDFTDPVTVETKVKLQEGIDGIFELWLTFEKGGQPIALRYHGGCYGSQREVFVTMGDKHINYNLTGILPPVGQELLTFGIGLEEDKTELYIADQTGKFLWDVSYPICALKGNGFVSFGQNIDCPNGGTWTLKALVDSLLVAQPYPHIEQLISQLEETKHTQTVHEISLDSMVPYGVPETSWHQMQGDELVISSGSGDAQLVETPQIYTLPLRIDMTAKTNATNIRLYFGFGEVIFDWECNTKELRVHDPFDGGNYGYDDMGYIQPGEYADITWILGEDAMEIYVNGQLRHRGTHYPYLTAMKKSPIQSALRISSAFGSTVTVRNLKITPIGKETEEIALHTLCPTGALTYEYTEDALKMCCQGDVVGFQTPGEYSLPLCIQMTAQTNNTNIRLMFGPGGLIFNWECNKGQLRVHDPSIGKGYGDSGAGLVPTNTDVTIHWLMTRKGMWVYVDGQLRHYSKDYPYTESLRNQQQIRYPIRVSSAFGSTVTLKSLTVTQLEGDKPQTSNDDNKMLPHLRDLCDGMQGHNFGLPDCLKFTFEHLNDFTDINYWDIAAVTGDTVAPVYNRNPANGCEYSVSGYLAGESYLNYVMNAFGYDYTYLTAQKVAENPSVFREKLVEYINQGIPVTVVGCFKDVLSLHTDVSTYCVVVGYEEKGQILKLISGDKILTARLEEVLTLNFLFIGNKLREVTKEELYLRAVTKAADWLTLPEQDGMCVGIGALRAWAQAIEQGRYQNTQFNPWDDYGVYVCNIATTGIGYFGYFKKLAELSDTYQACNDMFEKLFALTPWESKDGGRTMLWIELDNLDAGFNAFHSDLDYEGVAATMKNPEKWSKVGVLLNDWADRLEQSAHLLQTEPVMETLKERLAVLSAKKTNRLCRSFQRLCGHQLY